MIRSRILVILIALISVVSSYAQDLQPKTLFSYGGESVSVEEFTRVFLKNNKKEEQTDSSVRAYLNLYINFKLKVQEAHTLGMDKNPNFVNELKGYREQLAKTYMTDTSLTDKLVKEAYDRMQNEVKASHILILCSPNALPKDTLAAYKKIKALRNRVLKGENFDSVAFHESEDMSAKVNYGNLGYFSAFDMIYPFETQAYNTPAGGLSEIFRTEYGYHFLKVFDKRKNRGEVRVSHLMLHLNPNASEKEVMDAKRKIDSIYAQLQGGANWTTMVTTYSEDPVSAKNGGKLDWIASNSKITEPFREAAFAIKDTGTYSQPVKTQFGWHIIRLDEKRGIASFDEKKDWIKSQVNREPARAKMSQEALVVKLKKENGFTANEGNITAFLKMLDSSIIKGNFSAKQFTSNKAVLFSIAKQNYTGADFASYLEKFQINQPSVNLEGAKSQFYNDFVQKSVLDYEEAHLDEKYPQFRYLMQEYHDGILLFNLTEEKVWNKAIKDTSGLKEYYELHKTEYMWPDRVNAVIYETTDKKTYKHTRKLVKKGLADVDVSQQINNENPLSLVIKKSKFTHGENAFVDQVKWKPGLYKVKADNDRYILVKIVEFLPSAPKALNEIRGVMTGEYQTYLEKEWIEELKAKYPVVVNETVLNEILHP